MPKFIFKCGDFADVIDSPLGIQLAEFLTNQINMARMETASELGRPAIEGIRQHLRYANLLEDDQSISFDRIKQAIDYMVIKLWRQRVTASIAQF